MTNPFQQHGAMSWFELLTTDPSAAKAFYTQLFGWELKEGNFPGMDYSIISVAGQDVGGVAPTPPSAPGMPPTWGLYITVDDVDATLQKCLELGGNALMLPMDIPNVGRMAVIQDPQGAAISVITYSQMP
jgi:uncharacterized protein